MLPVCLFVRPSVRPPQFKNGQPQKRNQIWRARFPCQLSADVAFLGHEVIVQRFTRQNISSCACLSVCLSSRRIQGRTVVESLNYVNAFRMARVPRVPCFQVCSRCKVNVLCFCLIRWHTLCQTPSCHAIIQPVTLQATGSPGTYWPRPTRSPNFVDVFLWCVHGYNPSWKITAN